MASKPERKIDFSDEAREHLERYGAAAHAVMTGAGYQIAVKPDQIGTPKDLRTGVNMAHVDTAALAYLLMDKGVFTLEEWTKALADEAEREQGRAECSLSRHYNRPIKLL